MHSWPWVSLLTPFLAFCSEWSMPHNRWNRVSLWLGGEDTNPSPIAGLDLTPRAFGMDVTCYSTGHLLLPLIFCIWRDASGDNSAVSLEFPIPFAREKWQALWYPSRSDVGYILPDLGIWEVNIAEFFTLAAIQLQALCMALYEALLNRRGGALGQ